MNGHANHRGNVLVLVDQPAAGRRIARCAEAVGESPVVMSGPDGSELGDERTEGVDLIITDLGENLSLRQAILERLVVGEVAAGVPQIHVVRDPQARSHVRLRLSDAASSMLDPLQDDAMLATRIRLAAEIGRLRRELAETTIRDPLTGLPNRRFVMMRLSQEFARARRYGTALSFVLLDVDQLRTINDRHGTEVGDDALRRLGRQIMANVRREDVGGRWGDTSFAAVLPGTVHRGAAVFANKLRSESGSLGVPVPGGIVRLQLSAGVSTFIPGQNQHGPNDLRRSTESALIEAKRRGGNRVFIDEAAMGAETRWVLFADRDPRLLEQAQDILALDDLRVMRAGSPEELFEAIGYKRPDLIVLDLGMLDDVGPLHERFVDRPVPILGLAEPGEEDVKRADLAPIDRYITKPFSISILGAIARDLMIDGGV